MSHIISGDAEAVLLFNLFKYPSLNSINPETFGIASYQREFNSIDIISGDVKEYGINQLKNIANSYYFAYSQVFMSQFLTPNLEERVVAVYKNNPLSVSLKSNENSLDAEFDEYGAITKFTYIRKYAYTYEANLSYLM